MLHVLSVDVKNHGYQRLNCWWSDNVWFSKLGLLPLIVEGKYNAQKLKYGAMTKIVVIKLVCEIQIERVS